MCHYWLHSLVDIFAGLEPVYLLGQHATIFRLVPPQYPLAMLQVAVLEREYSCFRAAFGLCLVLCVAAYDCDWRAIQLYREGCVQAVHITKNG